MNILLLLFSQQLDWLPSCAFAFVESYFYVHEIERFILMCDPNALLSSSGFCPGGGREVERP